MKKIVKILIFIFLSLAIVGIGFLTYLFLSVSNVKLDNDKLINLNRSITYFDRYGKEISEITNEIEVTEISKINDYTKNAFIAIEDKRFYSHNGVDFKRLIGSFVTNLFSLSFKEGASTISQQLIKNTHLTSEKTLKRKIAEIKLAMELEKKYSKEEILEKYLNTIYFGNNCYGITSASKFYFDKAPENLSLNESAILASIIKAPSIYTPINSTKTFERKNLVLKEMKDQGYISNLEYSENVKIYPNQINKNVNNIKKKFDFLYMAKKEVSNFTKSNSFIKNNLNVYTTLDNNLQKILEEKIDNLDCKYDVSAILMNSNGEILSYYSTCGDIKRQIGSIIKPLLVYAPAIERNVITPYSTLCDEKTDFNGYSPSNYNDKYYGNVTVKYSLAKSLNTCAVKILNSNGIDNSIKYLQKMGIKVNENDKTFALALGSTSDGEKLSNIVSAYGTFLNDGYFVKAHTIKKVSTKNSILTINNIEKNKVFSSDTTFLINDMLKFTVTDGTAKKLNYLNYNLCSKTGTVGTQNGNTDAYNISYNTEYVLGCWVGKSQGGNMENNITGATLPTTLASQIWQEIYSNKSLPNDFVVPSSIKEVDIDKISFNSDGTIELADELTPNRYIEKIYIKSSCDLPRSTRFKTPKIEKPILLVNKKQIKLQLCLTEYINAYIYKHENNTEKLVFNTKNNNNIYIDNNLTDNEFYYSILPYFENANGEKIFGERVFTEKIKSSAFNTDDWWIED